MKFGRRVWMKIKVYLKRKHRHNVAFKTWKKTIGKRGTKESHFLVDISKRTDLNFNNAGCEFCMPAILTYSGRLCISWGYRKSLKNLVACCSRQGGQGWSRVHRLTPNISKLLCKSIAYHTMCCSCRMHLQKISSSIPLAPILSVHSFVSFACTHVLQLVIETVKIISLIDITHAFRLPSWKNLSLR